MRHRRSDRERDVEREVRGGGGPPIHRHRDPTELTVGTHERRAAVHRAEAYAPESRKPEVVFADAVETDLSRLVATGQVDYEEAVTRSLFPDEITRVARLAQVAQPVA